MADFADWMDVQNRWAGKTFTTDEQASADSLILYASAIVRHDVPDVDARIAAATLDQDLVKGVVVEMVKRVMNNPDALRQFSVSIDDRQESGTYDTAVSSGELYLTARELQRLMGRAAKARAYMISPGAATARFPEPRRSRWS